MKFLEGSSLSRVRQKDCARLDRHYVQQDNGLWTESEEAGAVAIYPVSDSPIEGKVNFLFKETMPVEGNKGPDNPSTITGVTSVNVIRCGTNLLNVKNVKETSWWKCNGDGTYTFFVKTPYNNNNQNTSGAAAASWDLISQKFPKGRYTVGLKESNATVRFVISKKENGISQGFPAVSGENTYTFEITENTTSCIIYFQINANNTYNETVTPFLTLEGVSKGELDNYTKENYVVSLGDTYYGGSIDLATGVMTVTHYETEITEVTAANPYNGGTYVTARFWPYSNNPDFVSAHGIPRPKVSSGLVCDKLQYGSAELNYIGFGVYNPDNLTEYIWFNLDKDMINITESSLTAQQVRTKANTYLAENPIKIVYELYTPYTIQLDPVTIFALTQTDKYTSRLNTIYTDAESVQICYKKSPIREAYEQRQAIASIGGV